MERPTLPKNVNFSGSIYYCDPDWTTDFLELKASDLDHFKKNTYYYLKAILLKCASSEHGFTDSDAVIETVSSQSINASRPYLNQITRDLVAAKYLSEYEIKPEKGRKRKIYTLNSLLDIKYIHGAKKVENKELMQHKNIAEQIAAKYNFLPIDHTYIRSEILQTILLDKAYKTHHGDTRNHIVTDIRIGDATYEVETITLTGHELALVSDQNIIRAVLSAITQYVEKHLELYRSGKKDWINLWDIDIVEILKAVGKTDGGNARIWCYKGIKRIENTNMVIRDKKTGLNTILANLMGGVFDESSINYWSNVHRIDEEHTEESGLTTKYPRYIRLSLLENTFQRLKANHKIFYQDDPEILKINEPILLALYNFGSTLARTSKPMIFTMQTLHQTLMPSAKEPYFTKEFIKTFANHIAKQSEAVDIPIPPGYDTKTTYRGYDKTIEIPATSNASSITIEAFVEKQHQNIKINYSHLIFRLSVQDDSIHRHRMPLSIEDLPAILIDNETATK
jgi:hypothetical protein